MNHVFPSAALALALTGLGVAACSDVAGPRWPDLQPCGAHTLQHMVGQPVTELQAMDLPQPLRIVPPGLAVTMDFVPERLNADVDENGTILRLSCG